MGLPLKPFDAVFSFIPSSICGMGIMTVCLFSDLCVAVVCLSSPTLQSTVKELYHYIQTLPRSKGESSLLFPYWQREACSLVTMCSCSRVTFFSFVFSVCYY